MTNTRTVLVVSKEFPPQPGGVGDYCVRWLEEVTSADPGWEATVLAGLCDGRNSPIAGATVVSTDDWTLRGLRGFRRTLRMLTPDTVVYHYVPHMYQKQGLPLVSLAHVVLLKRYSRHLTVMFHEMTSAQVHWRHRLLTIPQMAIVAALATLATSNVATIQTRARRLRSLTPWRSSTPVVIPVSPTLRNIKAPLRSAPTDLPIKLVYFGSSHPSRNFDLIAAAMDRLDRDGVKYSLAVIGTAEAPDSRATVLGYCSEERVVEVLMDSDVALLPFADGASGRRSTVANCLAAGLAVVSTAGADTDVGWYGDSMLLVPSDDSEAFARSVASLCSDTVELARQRARGSSWFADKLSWSVTAALWKSVMRR